MIPITIFKGREVALFGLGGSGMATAKALVAGGARVDVWDDSTARVDAALDAGLDAIDLRDVDFSRYAALVVAPGVPLTHPEPHWSVKMAHEAGVEVIGDVELFVREREQGCPECAFVAITGTNGKSTTTALISHLLSQAGMDVQMGGNIGRPILDLDAMDEDKVYVIECSSYQIDLAPSLAPDVGVLLNLTPDHLDRHGDMESYAAIKERLVRGSRLAVVGVDDSYCAEIAERLVGEDVPVDRISVTSFVDDGVYAVGTKLFESVDGESEEVADLEGCLSLRGSHNAQNAAAAVSVAAALGLEREEIIAGLKSFPGLAHRQKLVARAGNVLFVNDSKGTNADATAYALASYDRIYWIAGGRPKIGGISSLKSYAPKIAKAYFIGEAAQEFAESFQGLTETMVFVGLDEAVAAAAHDAGRDNSGEVAVLLSPACASFDQYPSFEVRGEAFEALARVCAENLSGQGER
ncbi:UDP-N-acetylmuramoyl-L-alanine--D-glutamate ligase [Rhodobacteraceae bacterium RKSG542]|uniref:UDP-N-acetylmuramoyl-L-alanine--D-glutamate ligase n=1 Tax=Pseudovibrio flavus TaxID=2529854 RepID=UPI0012BD713A|nr:UDP-N-acetylmuramoyl-L-alanine--D-glutamate ligase [Pseudovibrio flavus]MTI19142.1 UDP-N-acetylmuramoyl-L-alanine--D-glutamate ligase [Pseudovibrio flavus]